MYFRNVQEVIQGIPLKLLGKNLIRDVWKHLFQVRKSFWGSQLHFLEFEWIQLQNCSIRKYRIDPIEIIISCVAESAEADVKKAGCAYARTLCNTFVGAVHFSVPQPHSQLMGRIFKEYLTGEKVYMCVNCKSHLSTRDQIISKVSRFVPSS